MQRTGLAGDPLAILLGKQHRVVSREQALATGLSPKALRHRLRPGGPWQIVLPGVYAATTGLISADQRDIAALLHAGPDGVITGPAALRWHGLSAQPPGTVDILVPLSIRRGSASFVRVHRTQRMPRQVCVTGEVRFTLPPRAVADAARDLTGLRDVRAIVASAVQRRHCTIASLARELEEGPSRGSALLRSALAEVADGIRSAAEGDFRALLKRERLPMPMFNARLLAGPEFVATVDAWWPGTGVAAEIDSREWHFSAGDWERTVARHTRLAALHLVLLHFTPSQVRREPGIVTARVRAALADPPGIPAGIRALPASA